MTLLLMHNILRLVKAECLNQCFGNNILGNALQGVSDTLANVEDIGREAVEGVDAALQNEYVRAAIKTDCGCGAQSCSPDLQLQP
jgi:hypothetical protein